MPAISEKGTLEKNLKFSLFLCIPFHSMQHQSQKDGSLVVAGVFYSEYLMYSHAITLKCNRKRRKRKKEPSLCRLGSLTSLSNALQNLFTVLVHPELGDDNLGGGDAEGNALAVGLLADNTVDVDNPLETVDAGDLALTALVGATDNGDLVVLAEGDGADLYHR